MPLKTADLVKDPTRFLECKVIEVFEFLAHREDKMPSISLQVGDHQKAVLMTFVVGSPDDLAAYQAAVDEVKERINP